MLDEDPNRRTLLKDRQLPPKTSVITESRLLEPNLTSPDIEIVDPTRANDLMEIELLKKARSPIDNTAPTLADSLVENVLPLLAAKRIEIELPMLTISIADSLNTDPMRQSPVTDSEEPALTNDLIESELLHTPHTKVESLPPKVTEEATVIPEPSRIDDLREIDDPRTRKSKIENFPDMKEMPLIERELPAATLSMIDNLYADPRRSTPTMLSDDPDFSIPLKDKELPRAAKPMIEML
jgi:hypothetical protein